MQIIKTARGRITGHFGDQNVPGANVARHTGTDIGHGDMTPDDLRLVAPAAGTVTAAGRWGTYGNRVEIDHGGGWSSLIAHMERIDVEVGEQLAQRADIGVMGSTGGNWPVHAHQELRYRGTPVDAENYFTATSAAGGATPLNQGDEELPNTNQVWDEPQKSLDGNAPSVVIRDTRKLLDAVIATQAAQSAAIGSIAAGVTDLLTVRHNGIDAPTDVVEADTRIIVGQISATLDKLVAAHTKANAAQEAAA